MDFSSLFLDPPTWNQQEISDQGGLIQTDPLQIQPPASNESDTGSTRPVSMVDRARQAQLPLPEAGLKCPRCDSSNTKFCYFNNYNLSQPRHFCKGCRRYWTRGGALRNVPVGGGCRRNKRTKSRAKSKPDPVLAQNPKRGSYSISSSCLDDNNNHTYDLSSQLINPPPSQPDPFVPGYRYLNGFGLNLRGHGVSEQLSSLLTGSGLTGNGLYPFSEGTSLLPDHNTPLFGRVKMDENQNQNLAKNLMLNDHHHQYSNWGINPWTDASGFQGSSSSTGRLL